MKVYISLPITGKDIEEQKRHAWDVASFLLTAGFAPVTPFCNGVPDETHIREDLKLMLGCDAVLLCDGWEQSRGCTLDHAVALACGLTVVTESMPIDKLYDRLKGGGR